MTRVASLCSGIGGIDLVCQAFGWDLAWHAEIDPDAARVNAARFGPLPNVGDIKTADWTAVEPVDVLTAGYPCQPFSTAGRRKAQDDPRHLWPAVRDAVADLRPSVVLLENVAGHVSLGLGQVLRDLAALGFDAEWGVLGSADVGGCHRRNRVWIAATDSGRVAEWAEPFGVGGGGGQVVARLDDQAARRGVDLMPTPRTSDSNGAGAHGTGGPDLRTVVGQLLPTPTARDWKDGAPCANVPENALLGRAVWGDFGRYQAAVDRWAAIHGAPPAPTDDRARLNPQFVEWMLGYPAGWVTDPELGLSRTAHLRALGNSVQPQAGAVAYRELLARAAAHLAVAS